MADQQTTLSITGMNCNGCVNAVRSAIALTDGVKEVTVDLAAAQAAVTYDPAQTSLDQIAASVVEAGYGVGKH